MNTSKRNEISEVVDIELSRDEDSVTSLAVALADDESIVALAGINSSQAEQQRGNNQHLRSFRLEYPPRKSADHADGEKPQEEKRPRTTTALSRTSLFKNIQKPKPGEKIDTYQRLLRLSPWRGADAPRIAAIATGLAPSGEIVLFNVTANPQPSDVIGRIRLGAGEEAEDVDIIDIEDGKFQVAYTNGVDVFTFEISPSRKSEAAPEVKQVYTMPFPDSRGKKAKTRPKFRALRFLSPKALILLQNAPDRAGCELVRLSLPSSDGSASGKVSQRKKLRKSMKIGLGLDVCDLGESPDKERQYIIAVAGNDQSIDVFTIEYSPKKKGGYGKLERYRTLTDVHPFSMTKICFAPFQPPAHPVTSAVLPQYVKLASVSLGNTVVVHTFPLSPFPDGRTRTPRYVLKSPGPSETWETIYSCFVALVIIAISCFLLQAFTEIRGGTPAYLGAADWLPEGIRQKVARPYIFEHRLPSSRLVNVPQVQTTTTTTPAATTTTQKSLRDLLHARRRAEDTIAPHPTIIVRAGDDDETSISVEEIATHHDNNNDDAEELSKRQNARRWEDLHEDERSKWKRRLSEAGHWSVEEGEQILEGILFG